MSFYDTPARFVVLGYRYTYGARGAGAWTVKPDKEGWFYSFYLKPFGKGARKGAAHNYKYVPRLTSKRRSLKAARERSYNLAQGRPLTANVQERKPGSGVPNQGYCMKQKKHVIVTGWTEITARNGRTMLQASCPACGTRIQRYGKLLVECPECGGRNKEVAANDYICKECRWNENNSVL